MRIPFTKYQGTGNDFVMVDQRTRQYLTRETVEQVKLMCDRRFGIGADGLILLEQNASGALEMVYFNSDGSESTMCGNGGRCFASFAVQLGIAKNELEFLAIDGLHHATMKRVNQSTQYVKLQMIDVPSVKKLGDQAFEVQTGSPHFVQFDAQSLHEIDIVAEGRAIRNRPEYGPKGINVNLVSSQPDFLDLRTYERGVEDETLSCGTGATAAALAWHFAQGHVNEMDGHQALRVKGGNLDVSYHFSPKTGYTDIWLCGPAVRVFDGKF